MFKKKNNLTPEQQAGRCADVVVSYSKLLASTIGEDQKLSDKDYLIMLMYCIALHYILVDRMAFSSMSDNQRDVFSDYVHLGIQSDIVQGTGLKKDLVANLINAGVQELSPHSRKLFAEKDEGMGGTLFWEFGKVLSDRIELDTSLMLTIPLISMNTGTSLMKDIAPVLSRK